MNMTRNIPAILAVAAALAAGHVAAADIEAGKKKAQEVCAACHNMDGISTIADYPKLAGQYQDYLAKALRDYKSGLRKNPIMAGQVANLKKEDIADLAAYFASQPALTIKY
jgi:cytochrome c553